MPATTNSQEWRHWASGYIHPVRFRGRDGWRSSGPLDSLLRRFATVLENSYDPLEPVYGFIKGRSTYAAARTHIGANTVLTVDLKDFFGQINETRVRSALVSSFDTEAIDVILGCCVHPSGLPLGFRTSPIISNLIFSTTDRAIQELCLPRGVAYTRWVDDLIFSGESVNDDFLAELNLVLLSQQWILNHKKTRFMSTRRVVLGLNIAAELDRPHVPRGIKMELRKQIYYLRKLGFDHFSNQHAWSMSRIIGMIAYVKSVDPILASRLEEQLTSLPDDVRLMAYSSAAGGGNWQMAMVKELGL